MNGKNLISMVAALGLAGAALAGEDLQRKMELRFVTEDAGEPLMLAFDADELGFDLHDLQEGENRSFVDSGGRNVLVTRDAEGLVFDVDGKTIRMPAFDGAHHEAIWVDDGSAREVDIRVFKDVNVMAEVDGAGVTILSDTAIDEGTRAAIETLLDSAGYGSEVQYIDTTAAHDGEHAVKVIRKKIEKAE